MPPPSDQRDDELYDRLAELRQQAAVAAERERQLETKVEELQKQMTSIQELVAKGRGVLLVLLMMGSVVGMLIGAWDKIVRAFGGHP